MHARFIIGADGVESMVGRWAGLDTRVPSRDMESCAQYVVSGIDFDPDAIYLHFGDQVAPGGYAWVFPKGVGVANVGLGIVALKGGGRPAREWLHGYIDRYFPTGVRTAYTVGGVIVHTTVKRTVTDGLIICGDAAHMVNPLSGGGIVNAMKAGRLAARTAVAALEAHDVSAARLQRYHDDWMALLGDDHLRFYRIKEALNKFDDGFYTGLIEHPRVIVSMLETDVQALLTVGQTRGELASHREPAPPCRPCVRHRVWLLCRLLELEEVAGESIHARQQVWVDAVAGHAEEAERAAGVVDRGRDMDDVAAVEQRGDVDQRQLVEVGPSRHGW